ncbi:PAS domain-containing protein [Candidatus Reidiella endopervernicosa]|uniref:histidine kinase n=1 Tax=Candidatus Reidiella endopervernicosa TaxID=2738883 RepID=A0A6N0HY56_9GAMM|nr:PAS domain-containing protein [Candidatus Reidiella endopervernicosa]QKQ27201.1 PAS domain-containing protein [Candidatus Reidiella endopervernicosa]
MDWDVDTGVIVLSERVAPMLGLQQGVSTITLEDLQNTLHPDDRAVMLAGIDECLSQGVEYDQEHRVLWSDGSERWLHMRGDVIRDTQGDARQMLGMVEDITRRKRIESELSVNNSVLKQTIIQLNETKEEYLQSESRLRSILDIAPEAIIVLMKVSMLWSSIKG